MTSPPDQPGPVARAVGGALFGVGLQWFLRRKFNREDELELEHPKWIMGNHPLTYDLANAAVRAATEIPDDDDAAAAIRGAGGKPKDWNVPPHPLATTTGSTPI